MAKVEIVELIDDLTGEPAVETVQFGLGSGEHHALEIDLSEENAARLREILGEFVSRARWVSGRRPRRRPVASGMTARRQTDIARRADPPRRGESGRLHPLAFSAEVRAWAMSKGLTVGRRGRISLAVIEQYERSTRRTTRKGR